MSILKKICKYSNVALAYSGGLDTSVVIKWLCSRRVNVFAYFADLGCFNYIDIYKIGCKALILGANCFYCVDCRLSILFEAFIALMCRAFSILSGTGIYFNITPLGRAVICTSIVKHMKFNNLKILSDGSTYKGNDIERFYIYSYLANKDIVFYKPWLDSCFLNKLGGRKEMVNYLYNNSNFRLAFKDNINYSIDSNILGNTYEGGDIENMDFRVDSINFLLCGDLLCRSFKLNTISLCFKNGFITMFNGNLVCDFLRFFSELNRICSSHCMGISDQVEDRIILTKSRGIYESPAMFFLFNIYDRLLSCIYRKDTILLYRKNGLRLGDLLYRGLWYSEESSFIKRTNIDIASKINGYIKVNIFCGNIFYIKTKIYKYNKYLLCNSTMERTSLSDFSYDDRIGHLNILKISL